MTSVRAGGEGLILLARPEVPCQLPPQSSPTVDRTRDLSDETAPQAGQAL